MVPPKANFADDAVQPIALDSQLHYNRHYSGNSRDHHIRNVQDREGFYLLRSLEDSLKINSCIASQSQIDL